MLMRALGFSLGVAAAVIVVLILPPLLHVPGPGIPSPSSNHLKGLNVWALSTLLLPMTIPLALPITFGLAVLWGFGKRLSSSNARKVVLLLACLCTLVSFATIAWIAPASNQAFRVAIFGGDVPRGANELTLTELGKVLDDPNYAPGIVAEEDGRYIAFAYHMRWALVFTTLAFAFFVISLKEGRINRGLIACLAFLGYYQIAYGGRALVLSGTLSPIVAAWLPNVALILAAIVSSRWGKSASHPIDDGSIMGPNSA